jgi:putative acetyltransferase
MTQLIHTSSSNPDFIALIKELDKGLKENYASLQNEYDKYNKVELLETVLLAYENKEPVGCGCFKKFDPNTVEIKRMFVKPAHRGKGISKKILNELENWAAQMNFKYAVLETGIKQIEAIGLYTSVGYNRIDNYGQYKNMPTSICFRKGL